MTQIKYRLDTLFNLAGIQAAAVYLGPEDKDIRRKDGVTDAQERVMWGAARLLLRTDYPEMRMTFGKDLTAITVLSKRIGDMAIVVLFQTGDPVAKSVKRTIIRCANMRFANKATKEAAASTTITSPGSSAEEARRLLEDTAGDVFEPSEAAQARPL